MWSVDYDWRSTATEGPDLTDERLLLTGSRSAQRTTVTTGCRLVFGTQPHDAIVGQHITGLDYGPSGPPVTVEVTDTHRRIVRSSSAVITVALAANPGDALLGGTVTVRAKHGVASLADLTLNRPGSGYSLTASSRRAGGATSGAFDESTTAAICSQNVSCQTSIVTSTSEFGVTANPDTSQPNAGTLTESLDVGTPLECPDYSPADPSWFNFVMSIASRSKTIIYRINQLPFSALRHIHFCLGAPYEFTTRSGAAAPAGILPDGEAGFIGLLPRCYRHDHGWLKRGALRAEHSTGPCVASRAAAEDGGAIDIVLTVDIPPGLPGDPWGHG